VIQSLEESVEPTSTTRSLPCQLLLMCTRPRVESFAKRARVKLNELCHAAVVCVVVHKMASVNDA
jgi:hypothetical protein